MGIMLHSAHLMIVLVLHGVAPCLLWSPPRCVLNDVLILALLDEHSSSSYVYCDLLITLDKIDE
jgi:hypothetical protein